MNNRKLYCRIMICIFLMGLAAVSDRIENEVFSDCCNRVRELVMEEMTTEDLRAAGDAVSAALVGAPAKVVSAVSEAGSRSRYGAPVDEKSDSAVKQVHAAAGGMVTASGRDRELGLYVKIRHENAVTVYGCLSDISVVERERVQRGEIIGSYDTDSGKEFYYELQEDL